jgi:hypothetical protein
MKFLDKLSLTLYPTTRRVAVKRGLVTLGEWWGSVNAACQLRNYMACGSTRPVRCGSLSVGVRIRYSVPTRFNYTNKQMLKTYCFPSILKVSLTELTITP